MTDEVRLWKENEELRKERDELKAKLSIATEALVLMANNLHGGRFQSEAQEALARIEEVGK